MRYFLDISYKGTAYHGWQVQPNATTVQQILEEAIATISGGHIETTASGRTDAGVHAIKQFLHFDTDKEIKAEKFLHSLNMILPFDVSVNSLVRVKDEAHARFDAISRTYFYRIIDYKNPFLQDLAYFLNIRVDIPLMNRAAQLMLQHTDFECFSKVKTDVNTFKCTITKAEWKIEGRETLFYITANRFLRGMVRAVVGTLLDVGTGKISIEDFSNVLNSRDRNRAGRTVPASGLFLSDVCYPDNILIY